MSAMLLMGDLFELINIVPGNQVAQKMELVYPLEVGQQRPLELIL